MLRKVEPVSELRQAQELCARRDQIIGECRAVLRRVLDSGVELPEDIRDEIWRCIHDETWEGQGD